VRLPVCFGQAPMRRFSAQKGNLWVSEGAPTETEKDGARERAWGGPCPPESARNSTGICGLRRGITVDWRRFSREEGGGKERELWGIAGC
jgi:hypothetical protein